MIKSSSDGIFLTANPSGWLRYADKDERLILPDPDVVFMHDETYLKNGMIAE